VENAERLFVSLNIREKEYPRMGLQLSKKKMPLLHRMPSIGGWHFVGAHRFPA